MGTALIDDLWLLPWKSNQKLHGALGHPAGARTELDFSVIFFFFFRILAFFTKCNTQLKSNFYETFDGLVKFLTSRVGFLVTKGGRILRKQPSLCCAMAARSCATLKPRAGVSSRKDQLGH